MTKLFYRIMCRTSEAYRIRHGFGIYPIRNKREARALYKFCEEQLKEEHLYLDDNKKRLEVYQAYINLYRASFMNLKDDYIPDTTLDGWHYTNVYDFTQDYAGWFWS